MAQLLFIPTGGGGGGTNDHFAPKYLVGGPGDDPAPYNFLGFSYIPDPGDGSGIATALAQLNGPGDVWIRPGTYDLGSGAVATPLNVPANVRVQGSGLTTIIKAKASGDQGVFVLGESASLSNMEISAVASATGVGSTALVAVGEGASLRDLSLEFATTLQGALREAVRFLQPAVFQARSSDVLNVRVTTTSVTGIGSPTRGFFFEPGSFAFARDNTIDGGDIGIDIDGGVYVAQSVVILNSSLFGVRHLGATAGGAVRIDEALIQTSVANAVGVQLGNGGHVLRSVSVQGSSGSIGVLLLEPNSSISSVEFDDMQVFGFETAFQLGSTASGTLVSDITIADSTMFAQRNGIVIDEPSSSECHLKGNTIQVFLPGGGPAGNAILTRGSRHEIEGNHVSFFNPDVNGDAVLIDSDRTLFTGNTLRFADLVGVRATGLRPVVNGNEITADVEGTLHCVYFARQGVQRGTLGDNTLNQNVGNNATPVVRVDSALNTIGDNSIERALVAPVVAGILLAGNTNTCIGNVIDGAPGLPVSDTGFGNEVAHNVGV